MKKEIKFGVKYNAGKLTQKLACNKGYTVQSQSVIVNIDWLSIRLTNTSVLVGFQDSKLKIDKYTFIKREYGTPQFNDVVDIWFDGYKIANLQYNARMSVLKDSSILKIENWVFYDVFFRNFSHIFLEDLFDLLDVKCLNISRLDICADGVEFDKLLLDCRIRNKYHKVGSSKLRVHDTGVNTNYGLFGGFYVGMPSSDRFIRYYNKSKEIREKSGKYYIENYFKNNGLVGLHDDIKRLEIQLDSKFMGCVSLDGFKYEPVDLLKMLFSDSELLKGFFIFTLKGIFEFKYNTGKRIDKEEFVSIWKDNFKNAWFDKVGKQDMNTGASDKIVISDLIYQMAISEDIKHFDSAVEIIEKKVANNINLRKWIIYKQEFLMNKALRKAEINECKIIEKGNLFDYINIKNE